jgi:hypothetical protein
MSSRKLSARTAKTRRLGQQDAANRCALCKVPLGEQFITGLLDSRKFCSVECQKSMTVIERLEAFNRESR